MTDKILEVRGLTKTYGGEKKPGAKQPTPTLDVLKGIDIDIYRGDVVCLIGPSGCGKSTFLRCLNRLEIPTGGSIKFEGVDGTVSTSGLVNINRATENELMTLPGIGSSRAADIINYRNTNGRFDRIEDIMKVSGIKESAFNKIKNYISV